ncbi:hypothetical protein [Echinicola soli]|nr:hypothetical protein [Echinicola soli]
MKKKKSKVIVVDKYEKHTEIGNMYSSRWRKKHQERGPFSIGEILGYW